MTNFNKYLSSLKKNVNIGNNVVQNKTINHSTITNFLIVSAAILFIIFILILVYRFMNDELKNRYDSIQSYYDDDDNIEKPCPKGCDRGLCVQDKVCYDPFPPNPKCCAFDNQCRFCKDKSGIIIASDEQTVRDSIRNRYYKQYDSVKDLNTDIKNENRYINKLNDEIRKRNESTLDLPDDDIGSTMPSPETIKDTPAPVSSIMPNTSTSTLGTSTMTDMGSKEVLEQGDTGQRWMCVKPYNKSGSNTREQLEACEYGTPTSSSNAFIDRPSCINRCYK